MGFQSRCEVKYRMCRVCNLQKRVPQSRVFNKKGKLTQSHPCPGYDLSKSQMTSSSSYWFQESARDKESEFGQNAELTDNQPSSENYSLLSEQPVKQCWDWHFSEGSVSGQSILNPLNLHQIREETHKEWFTPIKYTYTAT